MDALTDTKSLTDMLTPPDPTIISVLPIEHADIGDRDIEIHQSIQCMGVLDTWGGIHSPLGGVQHMGLLHPHITSRYPLKHKDAQGSIEDKWGVFEHMGVSGGVQMYRGI